MPSSDLPPLPDDAAPSAVLDQLVLRYGGSYAKHHTEDGSAHFTFTTADGTQAGAKAPMVMDAVRLLAERLHRLLETPDA